MGNVSIKNSTRRRTASRAVFSKIADDMLPGWDVSLVFVGAAQALALNKKLRGKNYVPNVLSYVVGEKSCEIIICPSVATKQASAYGLLPTSYCLLLFIHAVLHIKGWAHSDKMDKCERRLLERYEKTHSNGNRHRHVPGKSGRS